jgi:hypothetical protein
MIRKIQEYVDDDGKKVIEFTPIEDNSDIDIKPKNQYRGAIGIQTPHGILPFQFPFPENYDLKMCYDNFEKDAQEALDNMQKQAKEENLIVTPGQAHEQTPDIIR